MKKLFTTKNISGMAVMSALAFIIYLIEIPIFAGTPASFLELDLCIHRFTSCLGLFSPYGGRLEQLQQRPYGTQSQKYLLSGPL